MILKDGNSIFQVTEQAVSRLLVCGKCPISTVDERKAKEAFRSSFTTLAEKIDRFDEWGPDREVNLQHKAEYRKENRDRIHKAARDRRLEARIAKLRKETGK